MAWAVFVVAMTFFAQPVAPAGAQVEVNVRLEKNRYLAGEPVIVLIDVRNTGGDPVTYSTCDQQVRVAVPSAARRVVPNIFGCLSGEMSSSMCGEGHPPRLLPGQTTTFTHLLKDYDLPPGQYTLTASGRAGVRSPHSYDRSVPGAEFERHLPLIVTSATPRQVQAAFDPFVTAADSKDPLQRHRARAAIVEGAPPFLEPLIARLAAEGTNGAVDALGRIGSATSREHLKNLFRTSPESSHIVRALARAGHRDDAAFLAGVLADERVDARSRRYAALGLGHIGGDDAVWRLAGALPTASAETRPAIATALGNSRARRAVPVLIGMFGNNPERNEVCGALLVLTHRSWCGSAIDPAAQRRKWLRAWNEDGSRAPVFGTDNCPSLDPVVRLGRPPEEIPELRAPRRSSAAPSPAADVSDPPGAIGDVAEVQLGGISPARPHPAQLVRISTSALARIGDHVQLNDARGRQWRIATGVDGDGVLFRLPDDVADGRASMRVERIINGEARLSPPLVFDVTSAPLPLDPVAAGGMEPVAPGQWTDLVADHQIEFELARADRVEVEFRQGNDTAISQASGPYNVHVRVPAHLKAGTVSVRTRTWIERTASEWSAPATWTLLAHASAPSVTTIQAGPYRNLVWWSGESGPAVARAQAGEALVLFGRFPVVNANRLRVFLHGTQRNVEFQPTDLEKGIRVALPEDIRPGDWDRIVATRERSTRPRKITTVRVSSRSVLP